VGGCQRQDRAIISGDHQISETQTPSQCGWQESDHRRHKEALGAKAGRDEALVDHIGASDPKSFLLGAVDCSVLHNDGSATPASLSGIGVQLGL
jgi:hypothetical protein